jgi:hypothetical protein
LAEPTGLLFGGSLGLFPEAHQHGGPELLRGGVQTLSVLLFHLLRGSLSVCRSLLGSLKQAGLLPGHFVGLVARSLEVCGVSLCRLPGTLEFALKGMRAIKGKRHGDLTAGIAQGQVGLVRSGVFQPLQQEVLKEQCCRRVIDGTGQVEICRIVREPVAHQRRLSSG